MFPQPTSKPQSDSDFNRDSERKDDSKVIESSSPKLIVGKTKKILKKGSEDYLNFYKIRYNRLRALHSRWTPKQISSIIKLEWKKEKVNNYKKTRRTVGRLGPRRVGKILSGYRFYRKYRGFTSK
jgi:hypothetical protein